MTCHVPNAALGHPISRHQPCELLYKSLDEYEQELSHLPLRDVVYRYEKGERSRQGKHQDSVDSVVHAFHLAKLMLIIICYAS